MNVRRLCSGMVRRCVRLVRHLASIDLAPAPTTEQLAVALPDHHHR